MEGESSTSQVSPRSSQSPTPSKTSREFGIEQLRSAGCLHPRLSVDAYLLETFTWNSAYTSSCASEGDNIEEDESMVDSDTRASLELVRVMARTDGWPSAGVTCFDVEEGTWFSGTIGEPGHNGSRSSIRMLRLDRWIEGLEEENRSIGGEVNLECRGRSSLYDEGSPEVFTDGSELRLMQHQQASGTIQDHRASDEVRVIRRSCVSDITSVKKGNKLFRARRRLANLFRRVERPVDSVIAAERFRIE